MIHRMTVVPAQAGTQSALQKLLKKNCALRQHNWTPACAGVTRVFSYPSQILRRRYR
jgi:hypothetical protein